MPSYLIGDSDWRSGRAARLYVASSWRCGPETDSRAQKKGRGEKNTAPCKGLYERCSLAFGYRVRILAQEVQSCCFFRRKFRLHGLRLLLRNFREELDVAVALEARAGGNQPAHDHVFLQAAQVIDLSGNRGLGKDARRLLEACRGD